MFDTNSGARHRQTSPQVWCYCVTSQQTTAYTCVNWDLMNTGLNLAMSDLQQPATRGSVRGCGASPVSLHEDDVHNVVADMSLSLNLNIFSCKKFMSEN